MSKKKLETLPQRERILLTLEITENRYEFPEGKMMHPIGFESYVRYCIADSQSKGFYVKSVHLRKPTVDNIVCKSRTLILKVGKLPTLNLSNVC